MRVLSSLCWPRLHFDLPNLILRFRPPNKGIARSAPQTPSKNAIKYICKKGTFFWRHQDVLHPMAEYSSTPKGGTRVPLKYPKGTDQRKHMGDNAKWRSLQCDSGSAIWSHTPPTRSDLRTSQTPSSTKSANAHFQPQDDLVCRRRRCGKHEKWRGMRPSILTIHRTVTTRRADFAVHLTRGSQSPP